MGIWFWSGRSMTSSILFKSMRLLYIVLLWHLGPKSLRASCLRRSSRLLWHKGSRKWPQILAIMIPLLCMDSITRSKRTRLLGLLRKNSNNQKKFLETHFLLNDFRRLLFLIDRGGEGWASMGKTHLKNIWIAIHEFYIIKEKMHFYLNVFTIFT